MKRLLPTRIAGLFFTLGLVVAAGCAEPRDAADSAAEGPVEEAAAEDTAASDALDADASTSYDPWERARARGVTFRAIGQEPGWTLELMGSDSLLLALDYGERRLAFSDPAIGVEEGRVMHRAGSGDDSVTVVVDEMHCADVMSGELHDATVTVTFDGETFHGCGQAL